MSCDESLIKIAPGANLFTFQTGDRKKNPAFSADQGGNHIRQGEAIWLAHGQGTARNIQLTILAQSWPHNRCASSDIISLVVMRKMDVPS